MKKIFISAVLFFVLCAAVGCGQVDEKNITDNAAAVSDTVTESETTAAKTEITELTAAVSDTVTESETTSAKTEITELTELKAAISDETQKGTEKSSSIIEQCMENFINEVYTFDKENIHDTLVYDINNDGMDELLIRCYGGRGADIHVYKMYNESFSYCGFIHSIMFKLNDSIKDFPINDSDFYDKIDIRKFEYNGMEYNVLLYSRTHAMLSGHYNYITGIDLDDEEQIREIPIMEWGIDIEYEGWGPVTEPHNYFYLSGDEPVEISDDDVEYYLSLVA